MGEKTKLNLKKQKFLTVSTFLGFYLLSVGNAKGINFLLHTFVANSTTQFLSNSFQILKKTIVRQTVVLIGWITLGLEALLGPFIYYVSICKGGGKGGSENAYFCLFSVLKTCLRRGEGG